MILKVPIYIEVDVKHQEFNGELVKFLSDAFTRSLETQRGSKNQVFFVPKGKIPGVPKDTEILYYLLPYREVIEKMRKGS